MENDEIIKHAINYVRDNNEKFTMEEKFDFLAKLEEFLKANSLVVDDDIYDFALYLGTLKNRPREEKFLNYIREKYGRIKFRKIMDVGSGRLCKLSQSLSKFYGDKMIAIDPNIRLTKFQAKNMGGFEIRKENFCCDEYSKTGNGTDIKEMDYLFGVHPSEATEHIIRQSLKYDKPFEIMLDDIPQKSLTGKEFVDCGYWYEYLMSISKEVKIKPHGDSFFATNNLDSNNGLER